MNDVKDVGKTSDLVQALLNTVSIEYHAIMSHFKEPNNKQWLELRDIARTIRRRWLDKLVKESKGELWCISKHSLQACMAYLEVGDRLYNQKKGKEAEEAYEDARVLLGLFLTLNGINED